MRFSLVHKLASYLMALAAFAATALSGELMPVLAWGVIVLIPLSWFWEAPRIKLARYEFLWNVGTAVCFVWVLTQFLRPDGTLLASGVNLLVFLLTNKLFNRRTSKDYLQLYVISFLLLVAATTLNTDFSYAICFLAYTVFATWALTLFHLRREMEENYLLKHSADAQSEKVEVERILNSRRIVGGKFLLGTSGVSFAVFLGALIVFFLFPRVGMGFFFARQRHGQTLSGFSERVDLGMHGAIKNNPQVVMRIEFPGSNDIATRDLHFRGIAFDYYALGGQWLHTKNGRHRLSWSGGQALMPGVTAAEKPDLVQEVYLEPLNSRVLFGATRPLRVELPFTPLTDRTRVGLVGSEEDEVYTTTDRPAGFKYTVHSLVREPSPHQLAQEPQFSMPDNLQQYLQLPAGLSPRIAELARGVTRKANGPWAKAIAIRDYLQRNYRYTTDLPPVRTGDPLDEFLFDTRAGHCEYFATAMTIMLREVGVPTREVNGFYGGEWNDFGHYLAVRQMDAHAWVEVLFPEHGWVTFDPTPPAGAIAPPTGGFFQKLRQIEDSIELAWYKHMVEYNLDQQVELARGVQRWSIRNNLFRLSVLKRPALWLFATGSFGLVALRLWRRRGKGEKLKRKQPLRQKQQPVMTLYQKVLRRCARAGAERAPTQTPGEFARGLVSRGFPGAEVVDAATDLYYRSRFGGHDPLLAELAAISEKLDRIGRAP
jgi:transglutaminase-like putative cysteine protease